MGTLAFWLALVVALVPIAWAPVRHVPGRLRWAREATAARDLVANGDGHVRLFALRALHRRPLSELRRVSPDPLAAYEAGEPVAVAALARLELAAYGLDPPFAVPPDPP